MSQRERKQAASSADPAEARADVLEPSRATELEGCNYTTFDGSPGSTHRLVVDMVPRGSRVLEFGCATGYMSEVLRSERGCEVTGVEIFPPAAEQARSRCDRVIVGDAEQLDLASLFEGETFEAILFADVLEHLREPAAVLRRARPLLASGGAVIASIPNVAHASVRLSLLAGRFRYRPTGLLDEDHLRFFTRESIQDLFEACGYVATHWLRVRARLDQSELAEDARAGPETQALLADDPEATTYQFVVRAVASDDSEQLAALRALLDEAQVEAGELGALLAQLDERVSELNALRDDFDALRRAHDAQSRHLISERLAVAEHEAALLSEIEELKADVEWRKGVMKHYEEQLEWLRNSRSMRYTASVRRLANTLRSRRS